MSNYAELEQVLKAVHDCGQYGAIHSNAIGGPAVFTNFGWLHSMADFEQWPFKTGERDWAEDFSHENGNYQNKCSNCDHFFLGHKRRVVCKACAAASRIVAVPVSFLECHSALDRPENTDDLAPRVLETLTWLEGERYDMTLDEAFDVLRFSWKKVHGRTERQLILQIASLLASQSGINSEQIKPAECKCSLRIKLVGDGCAVCNPKLAEELSGQSGMDAA